MCYECKNSKYVRKNDIDNVRKRRNRQQDHYNTGKNAGKKERQEADGSGN